VENPVPGNLKRHYSTWKLITTDAQILNWIKHGVDFFVSKKHQLIHKVIPQFTLSTQDHSTIQMEIEKLLQEGAISKVQKSELFLISPVFTVPKSNGKRRMVVDLRVLNDHMTIPHFKMESIDVAMALMEKDCFMITWDLKSGFHHMKLTLNAAKWVGFEFHDKHYQFNVLPFGWTGSPYTFCRTTGAVVRFLRSIGLRVTFFVDDFILCAKSYEEAIEQREIVEMIFNRLGWKREITKGQWEPAQVTKYLGFILNSTNMTVNIPKEKALSINNLINNLIESKPDQQPPRSLAKLAGKVFSISKAWKPVRVFIRSTCHLLSGVIHWNRQINTSAEFFKDLKWIAQHILNTPGESIRKPLVTVHIWTDASNFAWGAVVKEGSVSSNTSGNFSTQQRAEPPHIREALALLFTIKSFPSIKNTKLAITTDNQNLFYHLQRGGGKSAKLLQIVKEITIELVDRNIELVGVNWISSTQNALADKLSRKLDKNDFVTLPSVFERLSSLYGPFDVDRFADSNNTLLKRFNSLLPSPASEGQNAFAQCWKDTNSFVVPPLKLIPKVLELIIQQGYQATIIVPDWSAYWSVKAIERATHVTQLGFGKQVFEVGPSKHLGPLKNPNWRFMALHFQPHEPTN